MSNLLLRSSSNLKSPNLWCKELNESIPSVLTPNGLELDESVGDGKIEFFEVQNGLWCNQIDLKLKTPIELVRMPKEINDYFILNFHMSKSKINQSGDGRQFNLGLENINILLASSTTSAKIFIPPNVPIKIFNIGFTRTWLNDNILNSVDMYVQSLFPETNPIFLSEFLDYRFKGILKDASHSMNNKLVLVSKVFQLLEYFFMRLKSRENSLTSFEDIHAEDLNKLILTKENIENNVKNIVSVENLAKLADMSLSKYKRLFKQVFGTTPYRYYLEAKLNLAMELLLTKKYSCSEVGHIIGYSNLSQFSKAFKKQFNTLPKNIK